MHAPGNNGNVNWGDHCVEGWLGTSPSRWDVITTNFGLHDLAYPDNEHIAVDTYSTLLTRIWEKIDAAIPKTAHMIWVTTTPVPTNPNASCVLIPGRIEVDVERYNTAAATALAAWNQRGERQISTCDLHAVINSYW